MNTAHEKLVWLTYDKNYTKKYSKVYRPDRKFVKRVLEHLQTHNHQQA